MGMSVAAGWQCVDVAPTLASMNVPADLVTTAMDCAMAVSVSLSKTSAFTLKSHLPYHLIKKKKMALA